MSELANKLLGIIACAITGCGVNVEQWEINEALSFCEGKGGVDSVTFSPILVSNIQCNNGDYSRTKTGRGKANDRD